jgi:hypothetical protein
MYYLLLSCVLLLLVAPLWLVKYNTLVDFPSHLARAYVLKNYSHVPYFQQLFVRVLEPMPNMASDIFLPPLLFCWTPLTAGKIFLSAIVLLFGWGCHLLAMSMHGRPSWAAPLCALLAYHSNFLYGFVNYCFGLGLFLVALALWMRFRSHWTVPRCLLVAVLAMAAYLSHLSAFVFLGAGAGWLLLWDWWTRRRAHWPDAIPLLLLAPPALLYLYPWSNKVTFRQPGWPSIAEKIVGAGALFIGYEYTIDALLLLALLSVLVFVGWRGSATLLKPFIWLAAGFLLLYLIVPKNWNAGFISAADSRFVAPAFVLALLSVTITLPRTLARVALLLVLACALFRWSMIVRHWLTLSQKTIEMVNVIERVRPENKIYVLSPMPADRREAKLARATLHTASYAVIRRHSVPGNFFAAKGVEPLFYRQPQGWDEESPPRFDSQVLTLRLRNYDYLWGCNLDGDYRRYLSERATPVAEAASCSLWDLRRP